MQDEEILALYFARDEQAIAETDHKYGRYCFCLAEGILNNEQDSEETVSDTYLHAWKVIPPKKPDVFKMFLAKVTRHIAFDRWRQRTAQKRGGGQITLVLEELEECVSSADSVDDQLNRKELEAAIQTFLGTLPCADRDAFVRRYFFVESTSEIAARYGAKENTIRHALSRSRRKLKQYLSQEGFYL